VQFFCLLPTDPTATSSNPAAHFLGFPVENRGFSTEISRHFSAWCLFQLATSLTRYFLRRFWRFSYKLQLVSFVSRFYRYCVIHDTRYLHLQSNTEQPKRQILAVRSLFSSLSGFAEYFSTASQALRIEFLAMPKVKKGKDCSTPGLSEQVQPARGRSLFWHRICLDCGRPHSAHVADCMRRSRAAYHCGFDT